MLTKLSVTHWITFPIKKLESTKFPLLFKEGPLTNDGFH